MKRKILLASHRGDALREPENTLAAFKRAFDEGANAVELDVRMSSDGVPVVIHDETVDRTTNGHGRVSELTLNELKKLNAGRGERIPTLEEALLLAKERKCKVLIDVKVGKEELKKIVDVVLKTGMLDSVVFTSFDFDVSLHLKKINPKIKTAILICKEFNWNPKVDPIELALKYNADYIHFADPTDITKDIIEKAHKKGILIIGGATTDKSLIIKLADMGVDGLTPDDPCISSDL